MKRISTGQMIKILIFLYYSNFINLLLWTAVVAFGFGGYELYTKSSS